MKTNAHFVELNGQAVAEAPTLWGLTTRELHDAYWAARGVQCVRPGGVTEVDRSADLFLLLTPHQLVLFDLREVLERLLWTGSAVSRLRIPRAEDATYRESIVINDGLVERVRRHYGPDGIGTTRAFLTRKPGVAHQWQRATTARAGWKAIRASVTAARIDSIRITGGWTGSDSGTDYDQVFKEIVTRWKDPERAIEGIKKAPGQKDVWKHVEDVRPIGPTVVGPVWLGRGQPSESSEFIIGPVSVPDVVNGHQLKSVRVRSIAEIASVDTPRPSRQKDGGLYPIAKRAFDVVVSSVVLLLSLPLLVLIALAIVIDSGRPVFFGHRRQTMGGSDFLCMKFRTMHQHAEKIVFQVADQNVCDGPQVYIPDDPRVTRVGKLLRAMNLDELPQLWNVLKGDMSIVGPRPSPERENRFCPAWRETRLSVRPGITGLWQIRRTRKAGEDFQEWIRYDIEYVRRASFWLDLLICIQTVQVVLLGRKS